MSSYPKCYPLPSRSRGFVPAIAALFFMMSPTARIALGAETVSDPKPVPATAEPLVFEPFVARANAGSVQLANGVKVVAKDWRTVIVAQVGTKRASDGTQIPITCSGTLVGPGVFLTAAHCLDGGASKGLKSAVVLKIGGLNLDTTCLIAKGYRDAVAANVWDGSIPRVSDDYALCHFDPPAQVPNDLKDLAYEVIESSQVLTRDFPVLMTGLGCATLSIDASGGLSNSDSDQLLRVGDGAVAVIAPLDGSAESNFVQIFSTITHPALCPGDSGGPLLSGVTQAAQVGMRRVRGVNSTISTIPAKGGDVLLVSCIASLSTPSFRGLIQEWQSAHGTEQILCGVNRAAGTSPCAR
jgi:Trypsin